MKGVFFYILFFIIPAYYCELISNNKITENFNLVEGIPYHIIHSNTKSKLNIDGVNKWFLLKANGSLYNIVGVNRESKLLALDGGHDNNAYTNPHDKGNEYQLWKFQEVKDNKYNIIHNESSRNLDSDGSRFYVSSEENNSPSNTYQYWFFEPSNYNITAVVMEFEYPEDIKDNLEQYKKRTALLSGGYVIENDSNATIQQTINKDETKLNSYKVVIRKEESFKETKQIGVSFNLGNTIFGLLGINTGFSNGITREFSSYSKKVFTETVVDTVSYNIVQTITVPPFASIKINSTIDKISINVPFDAKIRITGKADRMDEDGTIVEMADVGIDALRCFVRKEKYGDEKIKVGDTFIVIKTNGTLGVDGYGLESMINAHINPDYIHIPDPEPEPPSCPEPEHPSCPSCPIPVAPPSCPELEPPSCPMPAEPPSCPEPEPPSSSPKSEPPSSDPSLKLLIAILVLLIIFVVFPAIYFVGYKIYLKWIDRHSGPRLA